MNARKFTRYFLAKNDRLEQLVLFLSGCDQMACARSKDESGLRIFGRNKLLVIMELGFRFEFWALVFSIILLVVLIADGWVRKVQVGV